MPTTKDSFLSRMAKEYVVEPYKRMRDKSEKELRAEQYMGTTKEEAKEMQDAYQATKGRKKALPAAPSGDGMKKGGKVKKYAKGGSASARADGCCIKGKTRGKMV